MTAADFPYRHFATEDLLTEWECWRWSLAELDAGAGEWQFAAESRAFVALRLSDVQIELARRKRLVGKPHAPAWPTRSFAEMKEELTEIRYRLELGAYVEEHGKTVLCARGRTLWAPCPLPGHEESTASFHVDPDLQLWHCFGCHRGGDLFEFARQLFGIGEFWRVVELLRAQAGIEAPKAAGGGPGLLTADGQTIAVSVAPRRSRSPYGRRS